MAIRTLRGRRVLQIGVAALLHQLPFGFLLPPPLLLPQELLGLQEDSGVDAAATTAAAAASIAVPGTLVAGVPGVVLRRLEAFAGRVGLVPGVLGDGAGVLPGLPAVGTPGNVRECGTPGTIKLTCSFRIHIFHQKNTETSAGITARMSQLLQGPFLNRQKSPPDLTGSNSGPEPGDGFALGLFLTPDSRIWTAQLALCSDSCVTSF